MNSSLVQNFYQQNRQLQGSVAQTALLLIVTILFAWFIVRPQMTKVSNLKTDLKTQQDEFQRVDNDKRELSRLVGLLKQAGVAETGASTIQLVDEALPLTTRVSQAQVLVEGLASASGMELAGIMIDGSEIAETVAAGDKDVLKDPYAPTRKLQTQSLTVQLTGGIEQFRDFLSLIETSGRVVDVDFVDILNTDSGLKYKVKLKTYSYIPAT
jgi:hypothetical protein